MNDLADRARERRLPICPELLATAQLQPDLDPALDEPVSDDPATAFDQMRRRGLDPRLVRVALAWFGERPLELGLFSWDVLCRSLVVDAELLATLRRNAAVVRALLPAPGATFANFRALACADAVERLAHPSYAAADDDALMKDAVMSRAVGAMEELRRRHGIGVMHETNFANSTRLFGSVMHLCHLSTLASLYLDYALHAIEHRAALGDYIDALLDVGAVEALPRREEILQGGVTD